MVHDAQRSRKRFATNMGLELASLNDFTDLDALILAVGHEEYRPLFSKMSDRILEGGVIADVGSRLDPSMLRPDIQYRSL